MGKREEKLKKHNNWTKAINQTKDKRTTELVKNISAFIKNVSKLEEQEKISKEFDNFEQDTLNLIYKSLEETYSLTSQSVKDIYNITSKSAKVKDLTYNGDGKTLEERLEQYFSELLNHVSSRDAVDWNVIKNNLNYRLMLILDTETQNIKIRVTQIKVEGHCEFAEVLPGVCCPGSGGIFPVDELDFPPYHPGCMCEVIYYEELTDDEQEIEDLELEIENIYE